MEKLVYRSRWGARPPNCKTPLDRPKVKGIAVHYSGMAADAEKDHRKCAGRVRGIQNFHMDTRGWCDIAYSFVICPHGYIYQCRSWYLRTAAQGTNKGNDEFLAVCFLGNDSIGRRDVTAEAKAAFLRIDKRYGLWYHRKPILRPHSAFTQTSCPGDELRAMIAALD
jgi:hypothetical protein